MGHQNNVFRLRQLLGHELGEGFPAPRLQAGLALLGRRFAFRELRKENGPEDC